MKVVENSEAYNSAGTTTGTAMIQSVVLNRSFTYYGGFLGVEGEDQVGVRNQGMGAPTGQNEKDEKLDIRNVLTG